MNGGTRVTITYDGTDPEVRFSVGGVSNLGSNGSQSIEMGGAGAPPCFDIEIVSPLELECTTPAWMAHNKQWPPDFIIWVIGYTSGTAVSTGDTLNYTDTIHTIGSGNLDYFVQDIFGTTPVVMLDGVVVDPANYSYQSAAYTQVSKLSLHSAYLDTLSEEEHDLQLLYNGANPLSTGVYNFTIVPVGETSDGQTYAQGSSTGLMFYMLQDFSLFSSVEVDSVVVDPSNYEAREGSTIITLKPSFLDTLAAGSHTFAANFSNGATFSRSFNVLGATTSAYGLSGANGVIPGVPRTGLRF